MRYFYTFVYLGFLVAVSGCGRPDHSDDIVMEKANRLAQDILIVDTHIDVPYRILKKSEDISQNTKGNFDYPKARLGGLNTAFMSIYLPAESESNGTAPAIADTLIDIVEGLVRSWPEKFEVVSSVNAVKANLGSNKVALALGMENGAAINGDLANLEHYYNRGIRYVTLTHAKDNHISDSSYDTTRTWNGLSPFGRQVVKEMNRLGIMIDISHVSDGAFYQVMRISTAPVIASHSSCRHFTPGWERNLSDEMIRVLAQNGGVIQVNFGSSFINDNFRRTIEPLWNYLEEHKMKFEAKETQEYITNYLKEHPVDFPDVSEVVDHIDHVVEITGIDHVGFGSDFDGVGDTLPVGLKDVSSYPNLIYHLLKRGYSDSDIEKICSGNLLRVWKNAEKTAINLQSGSG